MFTVFKASQKIHGDIESAMAQKLEGGVPNTPSPACLGLKRVMSD